MHQSITVAFNVTQSCLYLHLVKTSGKTGLSVGFEAAIAKFTRNISKKFILLSLAFHFDNKKHQVNSVVSGVMGYGP